MSKNKAVRVNPKRTISYYCGVVTRYPTHLGIRARLERSITISPGRWTDGPQMVIRMRQVGFLVWAQREPAGQTDFQYGFKREPDCTPRGGKGAESQNMSTLNNSNSKRPFWRCPKTKSCGLGPKWTISYYLWSCDSLPNNSNSKRSLGRQNSNSKRPFWRCPKTKPCGLHPKWTISYYCGVVTRYPTHLIPLLYI